MNNFPPHIICKTSVVADGNMSFRETDAKVTLENRTRFLHTLDIAYNDTIAMSCNHGNNISIVTHDHKEGGARSQEEQLQSEVLITQEKNLALLLLTADCQPLALYDPPSETIALAHISRVTFTQGLIAETMHVLHERLGCDPKNILVHIGPHIHKESYKFKLPLTEAVPKLNPFIEEQNGFAHIDLHQASLCELRMCGITPEHISVSSIDTGSDPTQYSYFSMKQKGLPDTARMMTVLMRR